MCCLLSMPMGLVRSKRMIAAEWRLAAALMNWMVSRAALAGRAIPSCRNGRTKRFQRNEKFGVAGSFKSQASTTTTARGVLAGAATARGDTSGVIFPNGLMMTRLRQQWGSSVAFREREEIDRPMWN